MPLDAPAQSEKEGQHPSCHLKRGGAEAVGDMLKTATKKVNNKQSEVMQSNNG